MNIQVSPGKSKNELQMEVYTMEHHSLMTSCFLKVCYYDYTFLPLPCDLFSKDLLWVNENFE